PGHMPVAMRMDIGQRVEDAQRPGDHNDTIRPQPGNEVGNVLATPERLITVGRNVRKPLAAWVERYDVELPAERLDLWRPDPGRHRPSGNENDRVAGGRPCLQVMQPHAVTAGHEPVADRDPLGNCPAG